MDYSLASGLVTSFSFCAVLFVCCLILAPDLWEETMLLMRQVRLGVRRSWWLLLNNPDLPWVRLLISYRARRIATELLREAERMRKERE